MNLNLMEEKSSEVAAMMKQLGHPKKLLVLCALLDKKKAVGELSEICEVGQPQMSHFLKRMELEGMITSTRKGNYIYYQITDPRIKKLIKSLKNIFCIS